MTNRIAIIDDNKVFRKILKLQILKSGVVTVTDILLFENGKETIDFIVENINNKSMLPKTLFLDLNMPVMDGWKFLKLFHIISKQYNYNPIIHVLTSSVDSKDFNRTQSIAEVKGYLVKPISSDDLYRVLHNNSDKYTNSYL